MNDTPRKQPVYKTHNGIYYTNQLFYERAFTDREFVLYTLKPEDHEGYPSLRRLYLEENDPTEYKIATKYFGGWPHWKKLLEATWFLEALQEYREELQTRIQSESIEKIRKKAQEGDYKANQYLAEAGYLKKDKVGRPTREKIQHEANILVAKKSEISDDFERITQGVFQ